MSLLTPNFDQIPQFLKQEKWGAWAAEPRKNGKISKPPVGTSRQYLKTNFPNTWHTFEEAQIFCAANMGKTLPGMRGPISGVGILIQETSFLVGVDFDSVVETDGTLAQWAYPLIQELRRITYCEISPSGKGIRAFIQGKKPSGRCRRGDLEIYDDVRFLTVTGHKLDGCPNEAGSGPAAQAIIDKLIAYITQASKPISTKRETQNRAPARPQGQPELMTDSELIAKARQARNGRQFSALFDGDISAYPSASEADQALCNMLAFWTDKDAGRMDYLMRQSGLLKDPERLAKWDKVHSQGATYGEMTIAKAIQDCHTVYEPRGKKQKNKPAPKNITLPETGKPRIIYRPGELPRLVDELENSIQGKAWQRDTMLVRVINLPEKKSYHGLRMAKGTSVIAPFDVSDLMLLANKCADWIKIKTTKDTIEEIPIDPPQVVLQAFLSAKGYWTLPPLSGLVTCPIIRPDGSILDKPGYDKITGLYADFDAKNFPLVDIKPTKEEAQNALAILKDALSEFAFKTDIDRAVALAAMLTTILRPSVRSAPLFAFSAPTPGTGKSTLANVIGIIATGRNCAAMDFNRDENEFKKAVFASLMEGSPVTLIDNIMGEFNSSLLNIILSEETIKGRVLGFSKNASLPTTSLWLATGNNLTICGDMTRRTLICTLDAEVEKPAERQFQRKNLEKWILDHRGKLVHAALTILRAYHVAGKPIPDGMKPMNGFNDWSHFVRGSLAWLGEADPKDSQLEIEAHDPEREGLRTVLHAWHEHFGNGFVTTKDLLAREAPGGGELPDSQIALYQALLEAIPHRRELTSRALGKWLANHANRVIDGLNLHQDKDPHIKTALWQVSKSKK